MGARLVQQLCEAGTETPVKTDKCCGSGVSCAVSLSTCAPTETSLRESGPTRTEQSRPLPKCRHDGAHKALRRHVFWRNTRAAWRQSSGPCLLCVENQQRQNEARPSQRGAPEGPNMRTPPLTKHGPLLYLIPEVLTSWPRDGCGVSDSIPACSGNPSCEGLPAKPSSRLSHGVLGGKLLMHITGPCPHVCRHPAISH